MSKTVQGRNGAHSKASKRRKKQKNRLIIVVIEILVLLILAAVLFVSVKLSKIQKDTSFNKEDIEVNEGLSSESQEIMAGYTTIALFGLDNRSNGNLSKGNSDVIMIASINNDTHAVKLVSVYRDSYLDIGGGTFKKCNSAYAKGCSHNFVVCIRCVSLVSQHKSFPPYVILYFSYNSCQKYLSRIQAEQIPLIFANISFYQPPNRLDNEDVWLCNLDNAVSIAENFL